MLKSASPTFFKNISSKKTNIVLKSFEYEGMFLLLKTKLINERIMNSFVIFL